MLIPYLASSIILLPYGLECMLQLSYPPLIMQVKNKKHKTKQKKTLKNLNLHLACEDTVVEKRNNLFS